MRNSVFKAAFINDTARLQKTRIQEELKRKRMHEAE